MKKDELVLLPHNPAWREDFLAEKKRIEAQLNDDSVIEHIGSTAIPAVYAKPILDIAILCGKKGLEAVAENLTLLGYEHRGLNGDTRGRYYAVLDKENVRLCQAHIYTERSVDWEWKLKFRDVLRQNLELAREYSDYKLKLWKETANKSDYAEVKSRWVDEFLPRVLSAELIYN